MKKHYWLLIFLQGLIALVLGIAAVLWPAKSIVGLTWLIGAFLLLESVLIIIAAFWPTQEKNQSSGIMILEGIFGLLFALLVMSYPQVSLQVLILFFAIWAIVSGIIGTFKVIFSKAESELNQSNLFISLFKILVGILLFASPTFTVGLAIVLFGFFLIITGLGTSIYAIKFKTALD